MAGAHAQIVATEIERVSPKVPILFERDDVFYSQIERRPAEIISMREMRVPLELRPGGKSGHFSSDGGSLGRGDMPTYDKASLGAIEIRHALEWTTRRKWGSDSSRKTVINAFRRDLASGMKEFRRFVDSLCMTGGNGVLGTITTVTPAAGVDTYTLTTDGYGARLLRFGQDYRVFNALLTVDRTAADPIAGKAERTVTFIDYPNKTVRGLAVNLAGPGDVIVASGLTTTPPVSIFGVPYHHSNSSTGFWLTMNRVTTPEIRANRVNANGSALTLPLPRLAINKIGDRLGIGNNQRLTAWTHPCQRAAYEELGFELIHIQKAAKEEGLDLYFSDNMRLAGAPLKCSFSWDKTRIDLVDQEVWGRVEFHPVGWYTDDNGNKYFVLYGADGGVATLNVSYIVACFNVFVNNPAACSYIDGLAVPSGY